MVKNIKESWKKEKAMPLNYEYDDEEFKKVEPREDGDFTFPEGEFPFRIEDANEKTAKNGTKYISLKLLVDAGFKKPLTVFDNMFFSAKSKWRLQQFCKSVNLAERPKEIKEFLDKTGVAQFKGQKDKAEFGEVKWYVEKDAGVAAVENKFDATASDIPF